MISADATISSDDTDVGEDPDEGFRALLSNLPNAREKSKSKSSSKTSRPPMLLSGDLPPRHGQPISADSAVLQQDKPPAAMEASLTQAAGSSSTTNTKSRRNLRRNASTPARTDGTIPLSVRPYSSPGAKSMATSSIYRGVSWHGPSKQWRATIFANQKPRHLAYYVDEIEAARAYDLAAVQLRTAAGAGRFLNFPDDLEIYEAKINSGEQLLHLDALGQATSKASSSKASRNKSPNSTTPKAAAKAGVATERSNAAGPPKTRQPSRRTSADTVMRDLSVSTSGEQHRKWPVLPLSDGTLRPRQTSPSDASMGASGFWSQPLQSSHAEHASMHPHPPRPHSDHLVSAHMSTPMDDEMLYESDWHDDSHAAVSKAIMMMHNEHAVLHPPPRVHHPMMRSPAVSSQSHGFDSMMYSVPQSRLTSMSGSWDTRNALSAHSFADHGMHRPHSDDLRMSCLDESLAQLQELIGSDHSDDMM